MPELIRICEIIIRMYMEGGEPHHSPHFHAYYQEEAAVLAWSQLILLQATYLGASDAS